MIDEFMITGRTWPKLEFAPLRKNIKFNQY